MKNLWTTSVKRQLRPCVSRSKSLQPIDDICHEDFPLPQAGDFFVQIPFSFFFSCGSLSTMLSGQDGSSGVSIFLSFPNIYNRNK